VFSGFSDKFACTPEDRRRLGRRAGEATLDDEAALRHGAGQFTVSLDNLLESYRDIAWAQDNIIIAVSANADGTSDVQEVGDATLREEIEKAGHLMFASSAKQRDFWLGRRKASRRKGSNATADSSPAPGVAMRTNSRVGMPDEDRFCWIKGVPGFDTLRQAVIDPERAYVGAEVPTPAAASQIIDRIAIENAPWAQRPLIHLNPGLVAVIGAWLR
jgi:hypothetical protein